MLILAIGDRLLAALLAALDYLVRTCEPVYVLVAAALVFADAFVFFTSVMEEVKDRCSPLWTGLHLFFAGWLLFCVCFNHWKCVFTSPGFTTGLAEADSQALNAAMGFDWRWCRKCKKPKPPLCHHCSVCGRCVVALLPPLLPPLQQI